MFANNMPLIAGSLWNVQEQIKELQHGAKIGLQTSFENLQFITNISDAPQNLEINNNTISKLGCFKYLRE